MSKGSTRRPQQVPDESVEASFERIFGKKCKKCGEKYTPNVAHKCTGKSDERDIPKP